MDSNASYPLVCLPPEQTTLVPVTPSLVVDGDTEHDYDYDYEADQLAFLWRCFCRLSLLFWLAVRALRRLRIQLIELRCQANYWQAQHQRAVQREAALAAQVQQLKGEIREWKHRLFGRKSETSSQAKPQKTPKRSSTNKRSRGQQPGSTGHGRRNHDHLPTRHEDCVLADPDKCCGTCGKPREEIPGTADGDILEIEVRAHRRRYQRQRYRCT